MKYVRKTIAFLAVCGGFSVAYMFSKNELGGLGLFSVLSFVFWLRHGFTMIRIKNEKH